MVHTATLHLLLKQLKLTIMGRHWERLLQQSEQDGWNGAEYLAELCGLELAERHRRRIARRGSESRLPAGKSLASFDFTQIPALSAGQFEACPALPTGPARAATCCCSAPAAWARPTWGRPSGTG